MLKYYGQPTPVEVIDLGDLAVDEKLSVRPVSGPAIRGNHDVFVGQNLKTNRLGKTSPFYRR